MGHCLPVPKGIKGHKYLSKNAVELQGVETQTASALLDMGTKVIILLSL